MKKITFSNMVIGLVLLASLVAELYRFHGFLLLDLLTPILLLLWLGHRCLEKMPIHWPALSIIAGLFLAVGFISLLLTSTPLSNSEFLHSAFYGARWASLFGLSLVVYNQSEKERSQTWKMLLLFTTLLSLAGFIQLYFVPDFSSYEFLGWDPHQGRLLSSWFDPNLLGGYLAFFTPVLLGILWDKVPSRPLGVPILLIIVLALALTLSRSSYLALLAALFIFGLLRSLKSLALGLCLLTLLGLAVPSVQSRFQSLIENLQSLTAQSYTLPDASARLRYESWEIAWRLFLEEPIWGHGYNAYKNAALHETLIINPASHAATGSDSSLLTILATTGLLGFLPFFSIHLLLLKRAWSLRENGFALGFFSGLCGLLLHSIFVNSLLFPLLLAPFWITTGLLLSQKADEIDEAPVPVQ